MNSNAWDAFLKYATLKAETDSHSASDPRVRDAAIAFVAEANKPEDDGTESFDVE